MIDKKLLKDAEKGDSTAQYLLGKAYLLSEGVNQDLKEAEVWLKKAAKQNILEAYSALGVLYEIKEDWQKSFDSYKTAAENGIPEGECALAEIYYYLDSPGRNSPLQSKYGDIGIKRDYKKAFELFTKASAKILGGGKNQATALYNLGMMYIHGQGTEQNYEDGLFWLKSSAAFDYADAEYAIGMVYHKGLGVQKNLNEAFVWYKKAADRDHPEAQFSIVGFYGKGWGSITKDENAALFWNKKSAKNGYYFAQRILGLIYKDGYVVEQDNEQALYWLEKGAAQGDMESCFEAGVLHLKLESLEGAAFFLNAARKISQNEDNTYKLDNQKKVFIDLAWNQHYLSNHLKPNFTFRD